MSRIEIAFTLISIASFVVLALGVSVGTYGPDDHPTVQRCQRCFLAPPKKDSMTNYKLSLVPYVVIYVTFLKGWYVCAMFALMVALVLGLRSYLMVGRHS